MPNGGNIPTATPLMVATISHRSRRAAVALRSRCGSGHGRHRAAVLRPAGSGQGGYSCGLLAREIDGAAEVSLRVPPPLDRELADRARRRGPPLLRDGDVPSPRARPRRSSSTSRRRYRWRTPRPRSPGYSGFTSTRSRPALPAGPTAPRATACASSPAPSRAATSSPVHGRPTRRWPTKPAGAPRVRMGGTGLPDRVRLRHRRPSCRARAPDGRIDAPLAQASRT